MHDCHTSHQLELIRSSYSDPQNAIGFINKNVDPRQNKIPLDKQYKIHKYFESDKIYAAEGKLKETVHPIIRLTNFDLNRYVEFPKCVCKCMDESRTAVTCLTSDLSNNCYQTEIFVFCERFKKVYPPIIALLCTIGERDMFDPYGSLTAEEIFNIWLKLSPRFHIPNLALKWFAKNEKIANKNTFIEKTSEQGISYSVLPEPLYHKTVDKIEKEYSVEVTPSSVYEDFTDNNKTEPEHSSGNRYNNKEGKSVNHNNDNKDNFSDVQTSQKTKLDQSISESIDKQSMNNNNKTTKFQTYNEPKYNKENVDVDRDAVKQFVDSFAEIGEQENKQMKTATSTMIDSLMMWCEINDVGLNKLSADNPENLVKGHLKDILASEYDIEKARARIDGNVTAVFRPIELSDSIKDLAMQSK